MQSDFKSSSLENPYLGQEIGGVEFERPRSEFKQRQPERGAAQETDGARKERRQEEPVNSTEKPASGQSEAV